MVRIKNFLTILGESWTSWEWSRRKALRNRKYALEKRFRDWKSKEIVRQKDQRKRNASLKLVPRRFKPKDLVGSAISDQR